MLANARASPFCFWEDEEGASLGQGAKTVTIENISLLLPASCVHFVGEAVAKATNTDACSVLWLRLSIPTTETKGQEARRERHRPKGDPLEQCVGEACSC